MIAFLEFEAKILSNPRDPSSRSPVTLKCYTSVTVRFHSDFARRVWASIFIESDYSAICLPLPFEYSPPTEASRSVGHGGGEVSVGLPEPVVLRWWGLNSSSILDWSGREGRGWQGGGNACGGLTRRE